MRKVINLIAALALTSCAANEGVNHVDTTKGDLTGLEYIQKNARNSDTAGKFYFDCILTQSALQEAGNKAKYQNLTRAGIIEKSIRSCRPTGRHYARKILEETVSFDRRFYDENITKVTLPDIESAARSGLERIM